MQLAACIFMVLGACGMLAETIKGFDENELSYVTLFNVLFTVLMPVGGILWTYCLWTEAGKHSRKRMLILVHIFFVIALAGRFLFCLDYCLWDGEYLFLEEMLSTALAITAELVLLLHISGKKVNARFKNVLLKLNCVVMTGVSGVGGVIFILLFGREGSLTDVLYGLFPIGVSITFLFITWKETEGEMLGVLILIFAEVAGGIQSVTEESALVQDFLMQDLSLERTLLIVFLGMAAFLASVILHELGHLVFGLLTGYQFQSFRILDLMVKKEEGRLRLCRLSIAGTGGQCLMNPPDFVGGKIPYVLYNLGGVLMNTLSAVVFGWLSMCVEFGYPGAAFLELLVLFSVLSALVNGLPFRLNEVNNDSCNALEIGKDPECIRAWWLQLKINAEVAEGKRLRDMPREWFRLPEDEEMKNSMIAVEGVLYCNLLMEEGKFEETKKTIRHLLRIESGIVGIHRGLLTCDEIYCMIVCREEKEEVQKRMDKKQKKFMKSMQNCPSVMRTQYAYELCVMHDREKAERIRKTFEKVAGKYPYQTEIEDERKLMTSGLRPAS